MGPYRCDCNDKDLAMASRQPRQRAHARHGDPTNFAPFIAQRRIELGMTQGKLALLADVGITSVRNAEAGKSSVSLAIAARILDALGLSLVAMDQSVADNLPNSGRVLPE
jgi:DNA-binding XRE family transcriptional regulator